MQKVSNDIGQTFRIPAGVTTYRGNRPHPPFELAAEWWRQDKTELDLPFVAFPVVNGRVLDKVTVPGNLKTGEPIEVIVGCNPHQLPHIFLQGAALMQELPPEPRQNVMLDTDWWTDDFALDYPGSPLSPKITGGLILLGMGLLAFWLSVGFLVLWLVLRGNG